MKGEYGRISGEEEGNADYRKMVQPSQQHVAPCVKGVKWGFGTRHLRMLYPSIVCSYLYPITLDS